MNDAIREAFDLGKRFAAAYDAVDEAGMDRIEKEFSTLQSQTAPMVGRWRRVRRTPTTVTSHQKIISGSSMTLKAMA